MNFYNEEHERRYKEILLRMGDNDAYHKAVAYLFALDNDCYKHIGDLYDFEERCIKPQTAYTHGWQTGTSTKTTRLAYNLWNGLSCYLSDEGEQLPDSTDDFSPHSLFCCCHAPYFVEAIKLRFPDFFTE